MTGGVDQHLSRIFPAAASRGARPRVGRLFRRSWLYGGRAGKGVVDAGIGDHDLGDVDVVIVRFGGEMFLNSWGTT